MYTHVVPEPAGRLWRNLVAGSKKKMLEKSKNIN
jgi:hypothetical protein